MGKIGSFGLERPCVVEGYKRQYSHNEKGFWIYVWEFGPFSDPLKLKYQIFGLQNSIYARNGKTSYLKLAF